MIKDNIKKIKNYEVLSKSVKLGLEYLKNTDFTNVENGKYPITGDEIFAIVQDYHSKPFEEGKLEAHKKYIDIQYIVKGKERIGVGNVSDFSVNVSYDNNKDIEFFEVKRELMEFIDLEEGDFAIFYPQDAHMPSLAVTTAAYVKKVVVKIHY